MNTTFVSTSLGSEVLFGSETRTLIVVAKHTSWLYTRKNKSVLLSGMGLYVSLEDAAVLAFTWFDRPEN